MAYESTDVPIERSQGETRKLLQKLGAREFVFGEGVIDTRRWVGVQFIHDNHVVRLRAYLRDPDERWLRAKISKARTRSRQDFVDEHYEQEGRRIWRVIFWSMKARMVAVEEQLETFQQAFMPYIVDPGTNQTLWERMVDQFDAGRFEIGGGGMRELTPGS